MALKLGSLFGFARDQGRIGKQQYMAIPASAFVTTSPDVDNVTYDAVGLTATAADAALWVAPVMLPHNAQIDKCVVYGNAALEVDDWALIRVVAISSASNTIATAKVNTSKLADQAYNVVDNLGFYYVLYIVTPTITGKVYSVLISYTI